MELTRGHGNGYQPTALADIDYWYKRLPREGIMQRTFVDVGCGKGVVLRQWQERADRDGWWPTVVGIESDWPLSVRAWLRVNRYRSRIYTADAIDFNYATLGGPLLLWLFNSFGPAECASWLPRLQGVDAWVIANRAEHVQLMMDAGWTMQAYWHRGEQENTWFWLSNSSQPVHVRKVTA